MPKCCEKCRHLKVTGTCEYYHKCVGWRRWFKEKWEEIQATAQWVKKQQRRG